MANYLMKFKGTYRILPELDIETNDIPRDLNGEIADGYDDLYISCQQGNKIYTYGSEDNKKVVYLIAYVPSIGRGRNIKKALDEKKIEYTNYIETDAEVEFRFKAKDIEPVAKLMKAKTSGASISPFSSKNLPKSDVEIPTDKIESYKVITSKVERGDLLIISRITTAFLVDILDKKSKETDKTFDYKTDMKKNCMARQSKEYIYHKGFWDEYLKYLNEEIEKYYNE